MAETSREGGPARIDADREVCIGSGVCTWTAPDLFEQDAHEGRVVVRQRVVSGDAVLLARDAVDLCPSGALSLVNLQEESAAT